MQIQIKIDDTEYGDSYTIYVDESEDIDGLLDLLNGSDNIVAGVVE